MESVNTLSPSSAVDVERYVAPWHEVRGNLIMVLHAIQDDLGYVPRDVAMRVAKRMGIPLARIYEVITFYHFFKLIPPGKHTIAVCNGTACYLKGAASLLNELETELGIKEGETTADRFFHVETVRCIGCCGMSPAMTIDGKTFGRVKVAQIPEILQHLRAGEEVA